MLKIRHDIDLNELVKYYGFKRVKGEDLMYTDGSKNRIVVYPSEDGLIETLISAPCASCTGRGMAPLIDISNSGVMIVLSRMVKNDMIYVQEER